MKFCRIVEILGKKYRISIAEDNSEKDVDRVRLWDGKTSSDEGATLYFSYGKHTDDLPSLCVIVGGEKEITLYNEEASELRGKSLAVVSEEDFVPAFNYAQDFLASHHSSSFYAYLSDVAGRVSNYDTLVDIASQSFGASLVFIDRDFRILSYSTQVPVTDRIWAQNIEKGYCDYEFIQAVRKLKAVRESFSDATPMEVTCTSSPFRKLASRVYCRGAWIGFLILIEGDTSYRQSHVDMLHSLSDILAQFIMDHSPELLCQTDEYHRFLYNLIIGAPLESQPEAYRNLEFNDPLQLMYIRTEGPGHVNINDLKIEKCINRKLKCQVFSNRENTIVIADAKALADPGYLLEDIPENVNIDAGISLPFDRVTKLKAALRDAKDALAIGAEMEPGKSVYPFAEYGMYVMLKNLSSMEDIRRYYHPAFLVLQDYDKSHEGNLLPTLRMFLSTGQSIKETAEKLFMHRNSVIYRLEKIHEMTSADLHDPEICFRLRLSFAIYELMSR